MPCYRLPTTLSAQVDAEGVLHVPLGAAAANRAVRVTIEPAESPATQSPQDYLAFLQATAGAWQGDWESSETEDSRLASPTDD